MGRNAFIEDLSEDDEVTHFWFRTIHLLEVVNKSWPRLQFYLSCHKGAVKVENGKYSLPNETLLLLVLYRLSNQDAFNTTWNPSLAFAYQECYEQLIS